MKIKYHRIFLKRFPKLPAGIQGKFYSRLDMFSTNKFDKILNNHSVDKAYPGCRSINVTGDYRAIFEEQDETVTFINIGTHSELY